MATFKSNRAQDAVSTRYIETGLVIEHAHYTGSATLSAGDVIQMVKVPRGARGHSFTLSTNDLGDSGTGTLRIGDGLDTERYLGSAEASDTVGRVTHGSFADHAGHGYEYSANDTVDVVVATMAGDPTAAPVIKLTFAYYCDN